MHPSIQLLQFLFKTAPNAPQKCQIKQHSHFWVTFFHKKTPIKAIRHRERKRETRRERTKIPKGQQTWDCKCNQIRKSEILFFSTQWQQDLQIFNVSKQEFQKTVKNLTPILLGIIEDLAPLNRNPLGIAVYLAHCFFQVVVGGVKIIVDNGVIEVGSVQLLDHSAFFHRLDVNLLLWKQQLRFTTRKYWPTCTAAYWPTCTAALCCIYWWPVNTAITIYNTEKLAPLHTGTLLLDIA